jgi:hypothetical protein
VTKTDGDLDHPAIGLTMDALVGAIVPGSSPRDEKRLASGESALTHDSTPRTGRPFSSSSSIAPSRCCTVAKRLHLLSNLKE